MEQFHLAIALTLPYMLADHHSFAFRDDLLFVASGMVVMSLIMCAQLMLPMVQHQMQESPKITTWYEL
jgi:NhaP-type Na+/H+ or K+/H+ antiporter